MSKKQRSQSVSIQLWREKDILDFLGVMLLFAASVTVAYFQQ